VAGPGIDKAQDLVPDGELRNPRANFFDNACQITSLTRRKNRWPHGVEQAFADGGLSWIDAGGYDLDEDLTRPGSGSGHLHDLQDVDAAVLVESHGKWHARLLPLLSLS
jgi:hypothetical protein